MAFSATTTALLFLVSGSVGYSLSKHERFIGQTPWTAMNQLTERNLEMWQDFQRGLAGSLGRSTAPRSEPERGTGTTGTGGKPRR